MLNTNNKQGWEYSDLMGQFPQTSACGNKYIFVFYSLDANAILMERMQSKNYYEMLWENKQVYDKLDKVGIKPKSSIMDNEASLHVCKFITNPLHALYQKVASHCHLANVTEKAIQTAKHHFIIDLLSTDSLFPKHQWNYLFPQAEFMLNMLSPTRNNPKILAYTYLLVSTIIMPSPWRLQAGSLLPW